MSLVVLDTDPDEPSGANLETMVIIPGVDVDERRLAEICGRYGIAELQIEELADELTDLFGHRVDLVSLRALHPMLRPSVLAEARPVYAA